jgi:hypothetical protein
MEARAGRPKAGFRLSILIVIESKAKAREFPM